MRAIIGTAHFVSVRSAQRYYRDYCFADVVATVAQKIAEGEIKIGPPQIGLNDRIVLLDAATRYGVETDLLVEPSKQRPAQGALKADTPPIEVHGEPTNQKAPSEHP
jgi:hypothetical protein